MMFLIVVLIIIICAMIYSVTESMRFKVTDYCVKHQKVPDDLCGRRIMLLADLHCTYYGRNNKRLFDRIKMLAPDCIILAGDLVNGAKEDEFEYAERFLKSLTELNIPVYYGFGNHESKFRLRTGDLYDKYIDLVKKFDLKLLRNEAAEIFKGADLYGLELELGMYKNKYIKGPVISELNDILGTPDPIRYKILIAHTPEYEKKYYEWGADLVLSGHYHGGIIRLPFLGGVISPRMQLFPHHDRGVYGDGDHTMILSAGLGWHGIPFRFLNLPEIVIITLEKENEFTGKA